MKFTTNLFSSIAKNFGLIAVTAASRSSRGNMSSKARRLGNWVSGSCSAWWRMFSRSRALRIAIVA